MGVAEAELVTQCAWCKRLWIAGEWREHDGIAYVYQGRDVTHGICPECSEEQRVRLDSKTHVTGAQT